MNPGKRITIAAVLALSVSWLGAESSEPVKIAGEMPVYPEIARAHEVAGTVIVEALVDETGRVFAADVVKGDHAELNSAAVAAVSEWSFSPAVEDGKAVMKVVRIPINFHLVDPIKESLRSHDTAIAASK